MFVTPAYAQEAQPAEGESQAPAGQAQTAPADAHEGETHTETGAEHGKGVFPPFDPSHFPSQILWLAITFGLFYLFLKKVIVPRIGGILEVRRDRIAQDLDQAARMKEDADAAVAVAGLRELAGFTLWRLRSDPRGARTDVLALRLHMQETARAVLRTCQQLHGAAGVCDEYDVSVIARHVQAALRLPTSVEVTRK